MSVIDLTSPFPSKSGEMFRLKEIPLESANTAYTGVVCDFMVNSMDGSYLDLPGHIKETDDGRRSDNIDPAQFYRVPCSVIRLNRRSGSGAVSGEELEKAFGGRVTTPAMMINALGELDPRDIDIRSVFLDFSALDWMISCGIRLLVSDIYESKSLDGVFLKLFQAGICTVCEPCGMGRIRSKQVELTVMFPKFPALVQIPCRILADDGIRNQ